MLAFLVALLMGLEIETRASVDAQTPIEKISRFKIEPPPTTTEEERAEYIIPLALKTLEGRLYSFREIFDYKHTPFPALRVGSPFRSGIFAYFVAYQSYFYAWGLEEWEATSDGGFVVTQWAFYENRITRQVVYYPSGGGSAVQYIASSDRRWAEAVEKSKKTLVLLCKEYGGCSTEEFAP